MSQYSLDRTTYVGSDETPPAGILAALPAVAKPCPRGYMHIRGLGIGADDSTGTQAIYFLTGNRSGQPDQADTYYVVPAVSLAWTFGTLIGVQGTAIPTTARAADGVALTAGIADKWGDVAARPDTVYTPANNLWAEVILVNLNATHYISVYTDMGGGGEATSLNSLISFSDFT